MAHKRKPSRNLRGNDTTGILTCYFLANTDLPKQKPGYINPYDFLLQRYPQVYDIARKKQIWSQDIWDDQWLYFSSNDDRNYFEALDYLDGRVNGDPDLVQFAREVVAQMLIVSHINELNFGDEDGQLLKEIEEGDIRRIYRKLKGEGMINPEDRARYYTSKEQDHIWDSWENIIRIPTAEKLVILREMIYGREDIIYVPNDFDLDKIIHDFESNRPNKWIPRGMNSHEKKLFGYILDTMLEMKDLGRLKKQITAKL